MCNGRSTDSSGRFSIKVAAGTYRVTAFPPGDIMQTFGSPEGKAAVDDLANFATGGVTMLIGTVEN